MRKSFLTLVAAALAFEGSRRNKVKVLLGDFITAASGSNGGTTYSRNKGGAYRKNKAIPLQPRTDAQVAIRQGLSSFSAFWRSLSQDQIQAWNQAAKTVNIVDSLGRSVQPTGHNYFVALNQSITLWQASALPTVATPPILDPPANFAFSAITKLDFFSDGTPLTEALDIFATFAGTGDQSYEIWATAPMSPGISNPTGRYRFVKAITSAPAAPITQDISTEYEALFGIPALGQKIFIKVRQCDPQTGQTAQFQQANNIVGV